MRKTHLLLAVALAMFCSGCETSKEELLKMDKSQVELRQMQSRAFDTTDTEKTLRTIIATLQDLDFVIDKADATLGAVTATKLQGYHLVMTVSVRQKGTAQLIVRASAQYNITAVTEPKLYQDFFAALSKAMFLEAHQVD
jgi:cell division protein FtsB